LQVTLCDPYLSALSVRYYNKGAILIHFLPYLLQQANGISLSKTNIAAHLVCCWSDVQAFRIYLMMTGFSYVHTAFQ